MFNFVSRFLEPLRSEKWRSAEEQKGFDSVFVLPTSADGLAKLLAELSAKHQAGTPEYILAEHSLNMLLAKKQAKATLQAGWLGAGAAIIAALMSAGLGYLAGTSQTQELVSGPCEKQSAAPSTQP